MSLNLLPKNLHEFRSKEYWDSFFTTRRTAFEWYAEYRDLKPLVERHFPEKANAKLLMVGCGNSALSADLYDAGYKQITNIDYSKPVIESMSVKNKDRKEMQWLEMNFLQMSFADMSFDGAVDKGALDALYTDRSAAVESDVEKLFAELARVLKADGKYMLITLAQEHVLDRVLLWCSKENFRLDAYHLSESESNLLPFVFLISRTGNASSSAFTLVWHESHMDFGLALPNVEEFRSKVKAAQWQYDTQRQLKSIHEKAYTPVELFDSQNPNTPKTPRFALYIVDEAKKPKAAADCCVFIVPQGREVEWMFATREGHEQLAKGLAHKRVIVVTLQRGHRYESVQAIQNEIGPVVVQLAPESCRNGSLQFMKKATGKQSRIPFLSVGEGIGERKSIAVRESQLSGKVEVEEVRSGGNALRRLIFASNPNLVQTEVRMIVPSAKPKGKNAPQPALVPDLSYLSSDYQIAMLSAFGMIALNQESIIDGLMIGLGGGCFAMYMHHLLGEQLKLDVVELDSTIIQVAKEFFGFREVENQLRVTEGDGIAFVKKLSANISATPAADSAKLKKSLIILDVDSKNIALGISCPPLPFVSKDFLKCLKECMSENGLLVINIAYRAKGLFEEVMKNIRATFDFVTQLQMDSDTNCVVFCSPQKQLLADADRVKKIDVNLRKLMRKDAKMHPEIEKSLFGDFVKRLKESLGVKEEEKKENEKEKETKDEKPSSLSSKSKKKKKK